MFREATLAPLVGESSIWSEPGGVQLSVLGVDTADVRFGGDVNCLAGDLMGGSLVGDTALGTRLVWLRSGDGDAGDSGRRKGDGRGDLKPRGFWNGEVWKD